MSYNYNGKCGKGYSRTLRESKRAEAQERNKNTPHERTKAHRLSKCDCVPEG